jgi:hypothetical protein
MKTRLENASFSRETTKLILNIKVKGVGNLESKLTTLREELKKDQQGHSGQNNIRKVKYKTWWKVKSFLLWANPPLQNKYPIIDNNLLFYNLVDHYLSPFFHKETLDNAII